MKFFTTEFRNKKEKVEKYPDVPVLTQYPFDIDSKDYSNTTFELNAKAMEMMGWEPNKAKVNKVTFGRNAETKELMIANISGINPGKESDITLKNTFSNLKFLKYLELSFEDLDSTKMNEFRLDIMDDEGVMVATLSRMIEEEEVVEEKEEEVKQEIESDSTQIKFV